VKDVVPALQTNADGLKSVLEGLVKEYTKKQQEMDTWKVCTSFDFDLVFLDLWLRTGITVESVTKLVHRYAISRPKSVLSHNIYSRLGIA
jgi:hypothetical protein